VPTCWAETAEARMERRAVLEIMAADERRDIGWVMMLIVDVLSPSYMVLKTILRILFLSSAELVGTSSKIQSAQ
jgi:hypothetical protein